MAFKKLPDQIEMSTFGPSLTEQLEGCFDQKSLERYELISKSLTVCLVHSVVSPSVVEQGRKKLIKKIAREWKPE